MKFKLFKRIGASVLGTVIAASSLFMCSNANLSPASQISAAESTAQKLTISDLPSDYKYAADWIWENRIVKENSTGRRNTIFDQIVAGKGTINYVVKWQSYKKLTLQQRQNFQTLVSDSINGWAKWLSGYENWPYDHIDVKIVGWAVIDESCILDRQPNEIVYTTTIPYDSQYDSIPDPVNNPVPDKEPLAPAELSRFEHFADTNYQYPGGLDKRFDMYLWGTQGFPSIGGCGGDWGQRLSDDAYINMLDGTGIHVLEHELGHGFGMTDFYGGEGEADGFPPGGFPGGENSLMMAGSAAKITDFDGWMLRYMWTKIKDESGRFDLANAQPVINTKTDAFTDIIVEIADTTVRFVSNGIFNLSEKYYGGDESKNLKQYRSGDKISISFEYNTENNTIVNISSLEFLMNIADEESIRIEDTIASVTPTSITFSKHGTYNLGSGYYGNDESKNLLHYEPGDKISVAFVYNKTNNTIKEILMLDLITNIRDDTLMGDVNMDGKFDIADVTMLQKWLIRAGTLKNSKNGDYNSDDKINVFDLILMKRALINQSGLIEVQDDFLDAPIKAVEAYLPSQDNANLVIFYVDFPDCKYDYAPSTEEINDIAFGAEDILDDNYPFDSMSAFYNRSSKGSMKLTGTTFRYTTKENAAAYGSDKAKLAMECYDAFKDSVDFTQYDGDHNGYIDATLFTVPTKAGDDDWWPCAGPLGRDKYTVDGMKVGHIITGNAQIESINDYKNFNSSYLHEMGHCMGLPDYYLYSQSDDFEGMHGTAGLELMDADASSDFSAVSKLQLGWFRKNQIQIYDGSEANQKFTLNNAQLDDGNCVIIPNGNLDDKYQSEYFVIEYSTADRNNSNPNYGLYSGSGVRIYHVDAALFDNGYWVSYKYASGSEFTNNDAGRRFIRIIDDVEKDNYYYTGSVINNSISGFNWYDNSGNQTIDPGVQVNVDNIDGNICTITISKK